MNSATVPGAIAGYDALLKRFGTMASRRLRAGGALADQGWGLAERRHSDLRGSVKGLLATRTRSSVPDNGRCAGAVQHPPQSRPGNALRMIQAQGRDAFYKGEIAEAIVAKVTANGGVMTEDLAEFEPEWIEPVSTNYHGYDIFELPPPGQGFAALEMLNILEVCVPKLGFNLTKLGPSDPMSWHLIVEAKKLAYSDLQAKNGDPKFAHIPVDELFSNIRRDLVRQVLPDRAAEPAVTGGPEAARST